MGYRGYSPTYEVLPPLKVRSRDWGLGFGGIGFEVSCF